jgi:hypothetical protein
MWPSADPGSGASFTAWGLNRLPATQRYQRRDRKWKRYEKQQPGHRVQIDVKFIEPLARQIHRDLRGPEVVGAPQMDDLLDDLRVGGMRTRLGPPRPIPQAVSPSAQ